MNLSKASIGTNNTLREKMTDSEGKVVDIRRLAHKLGEQLGAPFNGPAAHIPPLPSFPSRAQRRSVDPMVIDGDLITTIVRLEEMTRAMATIESETDRASLADVAVVKPVPYDLDPVRRAIARSEPRLNEGVLLGLADVLLAASKSMNSRNGRIARFKENLALSRLNELVSEIEGRKVEFSRSRPALWVETEFVMGVEPVRSALSGRIKRFDERVGSTVDKTIAADDDLGVEDIAEIRKTVVTDAHMVVMSAPPLGNLLEDARQDARDLAVVAREKQRSVDRYRLGLGFSEPSTDLSYAPQAVSADDVEHAVRANEVAKAELTLGLVMLGRMVDRKNHFGRRDDGSLHSLLQRIGTGWRSDFQEKSWTKYVEIGSRDLVEELRKSEVEPANNVAVADLFAQPREDSLADWLVKSVGLLTANKAFHNTGSLEKAQEPRQVPVTIPLSTSKRIAVTAVGVLGTVVAVCGGLTVLFKTSPNSDKKTSATTPSNSPTTDPGSTTTLVAPTSTTTTAPPVVDGPIAPPSALSPAGATKVVIFGGTSQIVDRVKTLTTASRVLMSGLGEGSGYFPHIYFPSALGTSDPASIEQALKDPSLGIGDSPVVVITLPSSGAATKGPRVTKIARNISVIGTDSHLTGLGVGDLLRAYQFANGLNPTGSLTVENTSFSNGHTIIVNGLDRLAQQGLTRPVWSKPTEPFNIV